MNKEDFFEAPASHLRIDTKIPFDCFIYNEISDKMTHWLLQGTAYGSQRQEKLQELGVDKFWIMHTQRHEYLSYIGRQSGHERAAMVLESNAPPEGVYHILGLSKKKPPKTIILGLDKAGDSSKIIDATASVKPKTTVDAEFINLVIEATVLAFSEQFSLTITSRPPARRTPGESISDVDIASFIALTSQTIRGTVGLCFSTQTYLFLLKKLTGIAFDKVTTENGAGCGELMNYVFEIAKPRLLMAGWAIDQAIPAFVFGQGIPVSKVIPDKGFSIVFDTPGGPFKFEVGIKTGV